MNQPLGHAVGNALEVKEAIDTLHGWGPEDFKEHCLMVAAYMLVIGRKAKTLSEARTLAGNAIANGKALEMFRKLVVAQGGDVSFVDYPEKLPQAPVVESVYSEKSGYIKEFNARIVGEVSVEMGAGRAKKEDKIDHAVGLVIQKKVGDRVEVGDLLFTIHAKNSASIKTIRSKVMKAIKLSNKPVEPLPLFYNVIQSE